MWNGFYTVDRTRWAPLGEDDCDQASVAAFGQCRVVRRYAIGDRHRAVIGAPPTSSRGSRFANFSLTVKLCTAPRNRRPAQIAGLIRPLAAMQVAPQRGGQLLLVLGLFQFRYRLIHRAEARAAKLIRSGVDPAAA
jgi:hypothetical protein